MTDEMAERLAASLAAVKDDLAHIYTVWSLQGPSLEACTALTAMAQEEAGHSRALLGVAGEQRPEHRLGCLDDMPDTWPELVGRVGMAELAVAGVVRVLRAGGNAALASRTAKMAVEEGFHEDLFRGWFPLLAADAPAVAERFRDAARGATSEIADWLKAMDELAVEAGVSAAGELAAGAAPDLAELSGL